MTMKAENLHREGAYMMVDGCHWMCSHLSMAKVVSEEW